MPIKFRCPHCRQFLGISRAKAGALTDCPSCGRTIRIPDLDGQVKPLPKPELNLGDSGLAGALDALARLDAPEETRPSTEKGVPAAPVAVAAPQVRELGPAPAAQPVPVEPPLPAEPAEPSPPGSATMAASAPGRQAVDPLDEIIRLNPAAARSETMTPARTTSATLLAVVGIGAVVVFGLGIIVGRITAPAPAIATNAERSTPTPEPATEARPTSPIPPEPSAELSPALSGRLTYATADGVAPDSGARIIVLPEKREGTAKLPVAGFRAGAHEADQTLARTSIRALGGDYEIADEEGRYTVRLASAGAYHVLFISRFQPRDDAAFLEPALQEALSAYFDRPTALVGPVAYEFTEFTFRGDKAVPRDHVFERE